MTILRLKQLASTSVHAAAGAIGWNYDRAELIADGIVHAIGIVCGLIAATVHGPGTLTAYENYMANQIPVLWMPQPVYQISEIDTNLHGVLPQSPIESLTPENWYFTK